MILNSLISDMADGIAMISALVQKLQEDYKEAVREKKELEQRCAELERMVAMKQVEIDILRKNHKEV